MLEIVKNVRDNIDAKCVLKFEFFSPEDESSEYYAHTSTIKGKKDLFRVAKKLP